MKAYSFIHLIHYDTFRPGIAISNRSGIHVVIYIYVRKKHTTLEITFISLWLILVKIFDIFIQRITNNKIR